MTASTLFRDLKKSLSPKAAEFFDRLEQRPEVQQVLLADENEQLAARRALIARQAQIPGGYDKARAAAAKRLADVQRRRADAEIHLRVLQDDEVVAQQTCVGLQYACESAVAKIEAELIQECDSRLNTSIDLLRDLASNRLRNAVRVEAVGKNKVVSNLVDATAATEAVYAAMHQCLEYRTQALSSTEVESKLARLFETLHKPLSAMGYQAPYIEAGAVKCAGVTPLVAQGALA